MKWAILLLLFFAYFQNTNLFVQIENSDWREDLKEQEENLKELEEDIKNLVGAPNFEEVGECGDDDYEYACTASLPKLRKVLGLSTGIYCLPHETKYTTVSGMDVIEQSSTEFFSLEPRSPAQTLSSLLSRRGKKVAEADRKNFCYKCEYASAKCTCSSVGDNICSTIRDRAKVHADRAAILDSLARIGLSW